MILGIDVGGTFTDLVLLDSAGRVRIHKLLTSARDPSVAILQGIADLKAGPDAMVVHGTTIATNALLERRGARTALVTTRGFRDVLEIGRQVRRELYSLRPTRPEPLVPAAWRFEVNERVDRQGRVLVTLDDEELALVAERLRDEGIESVAVCLLFSFLNPAHEQQVAAQLDVASISLSSDVLPEYREYERTSTTVINAYVAPLLGRYLSNLGAGLGGRRLRIMQSNGGSISAAAAHKLAARTALSGPAGGVVGGFELARLAGFSQAITFDMGGTSTDVSVCPGRILETAEGAIAGLPLRLPIIDIHTVGAGGGSIARQDAGGALRVGPESAGAEPGPLCYGRPEARQVTVTDANLVLGRLDARHFLGGRMALDRERAVAGVQALARRLSLPLEAAAWGIVRIANSNMERAIRTISVERGHDPRRFTLVAFGGAGPLHTCELAAALRIPRVLLPPHPGVLSALGMVLADTVKDYSQTVMLPAPAADAATLAGLFAPLYSRARADLAAEGIDPTAVSLLPSLDMRYAGQSFELQVDVGGWEIDGSQASEATTSPSSPPSSPDLAPRLARAFHETHRQRFTYASEGEPVEIVNLRLKAVGSGARPRLAPQPLGDLDSRAAHIGYKPVYFAAGGSPHGARPIVAAFYERERLRPGNMVVGPAVIVQFDTTNVIPPGWAAMVDGWGNLVVEGGEQEQNGGPG